MIANRFLIAILAVGSASARLLAPQDVPQAAAKRLTFDVASVKLATPPSGVTISGGSMTASKRGDIQQLRATGGPGTNDPGRIHYPLISLKALIARAYDRDDQISGPDWMETLIVAVDASMPPETTQAQFQVMLRNLIADRFQMKSHIETKPAAGYSLVLAKGGAKIKESAETEPPAESAAPPDGGGRGPRALGPDGFPAVRPGASSGFSTMQGNRMKLFGRQQTMEHLARQLKALLKVPVTDATGLQAKYDYDVICAGRFGASGPEALSDSAEPPSGGISPAGASEPLPDIFSALQSQLGLKLEKAKAAVTTVIIDRIEKTPTEN